MESRDRPTQEFLTALDDVQLPHVASPLFKAQLKAKLLAEAAKSARSTASNRLVWWRYAVVAAALLMIIVWQLSPAPLPALAYLEIEVNPSVRFTVNSRGQVTGVEPLDEKAKLALQEFEVRGQPAIRVVAQVLEWWHRAALLNEASEVWLIVSPIGDARPEVFDNLLFKTQTVAAEQARHLLASTVITHGLVVDSMRYDVARQGTLRPSQYVRVAKAGVSASGMHALVAAGTRLQASGRLTDNRLREFLDLVAELLELGIPEGEATELIESLLVKGQSTRSLAQRIERAVERIEKGQELKEAVQDLRDDIGPDNEGEEADDRDNGKKEERRPNSGQNRERENEATRGNEGTRGTDNARRDKESRENKESSEAKDPRGRDNGRGNNSRENDPDYSDQSDANQPEDDGN